MDFLAHENEVRARIGEDLEFADFWPSSQIRGWLNEGLRRFSQEEKWDWLYTTATHTDGLADADPGEDEFTDGWPLWAQFEYGVSLNRHFSVLFKSEGENIPRILKRVSPTVGFQLRVRYPNVGPTMWYYLDSVDPIVTEDDDEEDAVNNTGKDWTIRLVPRPDRDFEITYQYIRNPLPLVADGDEPDCPEEYQSAIDAWAAAQCWLKELQDSGKANEQMALYQKVVDQARADQKALSQGDSIIWGGREPQPGPRSTTDWIMSRLPPTLGP